MVLKVADVEPWEDPLYIAMGQLVVIYNAAEERIRTLLTNLVADFDNIMNIQARIMVSELGAVGLENALNAIAGDLLPKTQREAVQHLVKLYERVRGYRNFYVHGIIQVGGPTLETPTVRGHVVTYSAKGALTEHMTMIGLDDIHEAVDQAQVLGNYARDVTQYLRDDAKPVPAFSPAPLPDKPPLPPRLEKPLLRLRERFPPPEA